MNDSHRSKMLSLMEVLQPMRSRRKNSSPRCLWVEPVEERRLLAVSPELISVGIVENDLNGATHDVAMTLDGRYTVFSSSAENLVPGDTNHFSDIFLFQHVSDRLTRLQLGISGAPTNGDSTGPSISADGRFVAFSSE